MRDDNGLLYLRARYYNPTIGQFFSLDPLEGDMAQPMSLNRYGYVFGNVINAADPSGMCPEFNNPSEAGQCYSLRSQLQSWGVNVVFDVDAVNSIPCIPAEVQAAANVGKRQRWTLEEMQAAVDAFSILIAARQNLGFSSYPFPINPSVQVEKPFTIPGYECYLGRTDVPNRIIRMSMREWGENFLKFDSTCRSRPYTTANLKHESRAWLLLHEFTHIFTVDRLKAARPRDYQFRLGQLYLATAGFSGFPTSYAQFAPQASKGEENLVEATVATLWNYGYSSVGFKPDAEGWYQTNVKAINYRSSQVQISVEDWVRSCVIDPQSGNCPS